MNYQKDFSKWYKGRTVSDLCTYYDVIIADLSDNDIKKIESEGFDVYPEDRVTTIPEWLLYSLENDLLHCIESSQIDDEIFDIVTNDVIKPSDHGYLVVNESCNWRNRTGYMVADSFRDALHRSYDVTQEFVAVSSGGKILKLRESSHDVPMGASEYIIALSKHERELADNLCYSFAHNIIDNFEQSCNKKL